MGDLWRSEPMDLVQLYIQRDAAHETFDELGEVGRIQFRDVCDSLAFFFQCSCVSVLMMMFFFFALSDWVIVEQRPAGVSEVVCE